MRRQLVDRFQRQFSRSGLGVVDELGVEALTAPHRRPPWRFAGMPQLPPMDFQDLFAYFGLGVSLFETITDLEFGQGGNMAKNKKGQARCNGRTAQFIQSLSVRL